MARYNKADYETPQWRRLRAFTIARAGGRCEKCRRARAEQAHHLTYRYGVLCPAQFLVAVCRECHERIHGIGPAPRAIASVSAPELPGSIKLQPLPQTQLSRRLAPPRDGYVLLFGSLVFIFTLFACVYEFSQPMKSVSNVTAAAALTPELLNVAEEQQLVAKAIANGAPPEALKYRSMIRQWAECTPQRGKLWISR